MRSANSSDDSPAEETALVEKSKNAMISGNKPPIPTFVLFMVLSLQD
jgi:hypothetical protein